MLEIKQSLLLDAADSTGEGTAVYNDQGGTIAVAISGTFVATIKAEGCLGGNWYDLTVVDCSTLDLLTEMESAGLYALVGVEGCEKVRLNVTSYTSGEVTALARFCF